VVLPLGSTAAITIRRPPVRALLTSKPGEIGLTSRPDPVLTQPDQAIIRIERVGLCGSDLSW
jgi:threonine dehydrogenase-like Zn-dependent dehydrogenase